jgi:hypothetical protein
MSYRDVGLAASFAEHNKAILQAKVCKHQSEAQCKALTEPPKGQQHRQTLAV